MDPWGRRGRATASIAVGLVAGLIFGGCGSSASGAASASPPPPTVASLASASSSVGTASAVASGPGSPGPLASAAPSGSSGPTSFTSPIYGYSVRLPPDWLTRPATATWDGSGAPGHDAPEDIDIVEPNARAMSVFAFAAPIGLNLAAYARDVIARNAKFHGDTCPPVPERTEATTAGDEPATFMAWNCGILIDIVVVLHHGVGYEFVMRDPDVSAATDPTDRKIFDALLKTLTFPA